MSTLNGDLTSRSFHESHGLAEPRARAHFRALRLSASAVGTSARCRSTDLCPCEAACMTSATSEDSLSFRSASRTASVKRTARMVLTQGRKSFSVAHLARKKNLSSESFFRKDADGALAFSRALCAHCVVHQGRAVIVGCGMRSRPHHRAAMSCCPHGVAGEKHEVVPTRGRPTPKALTARERSE